MSIWEVVISGIVQGVTEFLPISSSGHLVILHKLIGLKEPQILFDIFLHLGTLLAICIVFWKHIVDIFTGNVRLGGFILIATIATIVFVLFFRKIIEPAFANVRLVGLMFIVTGIWLILGNFVRVGTEGLSGVKAILIGLAQGIAAMPGISRSGVTISTGLFLGVDGQNAARFSFLLSIPVIIVAFLFKIKSGFIEEFNINYLWGLITACIIGIASLKLLLKVLYRNRFHFFGIYCILAGILIVLFLRP